MWIKLLKEESHPINAANALKSGFNKQKIEKSKIWMLNEIRTFNMINPVSYHKLVNWLP